jgi:hypothetical protein
MRLNTKRGLVRRDLSFPAPANPLDFGICPTCRVLVPREKFNTRAHKRKDQEFQGWLDELGEFMERVDEFMTEARKRLGMAEEEYEVPARYSAEPVPFYPDSEEGDE